ncbi:MAG: hypothetical protein IJI57_06205 [Flexilinea sp.]|nr:hypothetical protein [Flexilinea sp.]
MKTEVMRNSLSVEQQLQRLYQYGESGGSENRGILTDIKAADLPLEASNAFSNAPFDFETTAALLWEDTLKIYDHACIENRFSENYLKYCTQLEKNIKEAGSLCLTKAVLEKNGYEFPGLESMSVKELVGMVSFHLLKCHAALDGLYKDNNLLGLSYLNWEFRWFGLGNRLKATEVKIQRILDGEIKADSLLKQTQTFKDAPRTNLAPSEPRSLRMNVCALPLNGSMARAMLQKEAEEARMQAREQREEERWERELMDLGLMARPFPPTPQKQILKELMEDRMKSNQKNPEPAPEPAAETPDEERQPGELTEAEARQLLIERALDRGDTETAAAIRMEDPDTFYERWLRYVEEIETENRRRALAAAGRAGPSNATRKKLREKRRKKK